MNLKRLCGIATVALTMFAAALIAGCSNSMAGSVDGEPNARMATLTLSATGIPNDYAEQFAKSYPTAARAAARSITPNDPFDIGKVGEEVEEGKTNQSKDLVFYLSGKSETGKVQKEIKVELEAASPAATDDVTGNTIYVFKNDVTLDAMSWNLKLVAYKSYTEGDTDNPAVLQGFCSVDLRTGSGTAEFSMGTAGLDTKGSVNIVCDYVDTDNAAKSLSAGIYRKDTGVELLTIKKVNCDATKKYMFTETGTVPPGTYLYTMIFYAKEGCEGNIVGSFTDTLVVDPGNALVRTLEIDVIGRKPEAPTDLKAYLVNDSEGKNGSPTYNVKVEWEKSKYATNYELQVLEYTGDGTNATFALKYDTTDTDKLDTNSTGNWTPTIYGMRSMDPETVDDNAVKDFASSTVYGTEAGFSYMMFGDTSCNLLLETGKIYEIRLRGRNYIGVSEFVEREASSNDEDNKFTGFGVNTTDKNDHINRLLVTYHLNGGELKYTKSGDATDSYKNLYAKYESWTPTLAADTTKTALIKNATPYEIKNDPSEFDLWLFEKGEGLQDDGSGNMTTINAAYTDASKQKMTNFTYKNLTVLASYGNKVTGNISMDAKLDDIDLGLIDVAFDGSAIANTNIKELGTDVPLKKYTIEKVADNGTNNRLKITLDKEDKKKYKDVSFTLIDSQNKQKTLPLLNNADRTCEIDLTNYPVGGTIQVMISAVTNKMTTVSQTLIFELQ